MSKNSTNAERYILEKRALEEDLEEKTNKLELEMKNRQKLEERVQVLTKKAEGNTSPRDLDLINGDNLGENLGQALVEDSMAQEKNVIQKELDTLKKRFDEREDEFKKLELKMGDEIRMLIEQKTNLEQSMCYSYLIHHCCCSFILSIM